MKKSKLQIPPALNVLSINDANVHQMYASAIEAFSDAKLVVDLGALVQHGGHNQRIAALQIVKEMHRRILKKG